MARLVTQETQLMTAVPGEDSTSQVVSSEQRAEGFEVANYVIYCPAGGNLVWSFTD